MGLHAVKILGINITVSSKKEILEYIEKSLEKRLIIATPNPEQIVLAQRDIRFANLLNQADVAIPDGIGVARVAHVERIPGVELMEDLMAVAAKRGIRVALIGGRGEVAVEALECLTRRFGGLSGWAEALPLVKLDQLDKFAKFVSQKIQKTGVGIVFVGLGAPKQEYFINRIKGYVLRIKEKTKIRNSSTIPLVFMSVGGSFDIIAGRTPRAPAFMRSWGLEWLWRLLREPWRLGRQLALLKFIWLVAWERYSKR